MKALQRSISGFLPWLLVLGIGLTVGQVARAEGDIPAAGGAVTGLDATSPELARRADVIMRVVIRSSKEEEGGTVYDVSLRMQFEHPLKGPESMRFWKLFVPKGVPFKPEEKEEWIVFAKAEPATQRSVVLEAFNVKALGEPAAQQITDRIREVAGQQKEITVTMATDKPAYVSGEPITRFWQIKNVSDHPVTIYIGPFAFQEDIIIDGRAHGTGTGGTHDRIAASYKTLAPGEVYEKKGTIRELIPEGNLGIRMRYVADDDWVLGEDGKTKTRVPGVVFIDEKADFSIPIGPAPAEGVAASMKLLASPVWAEQREAMAPLSISKDAAARPEVQAMASHPWAEIRTLAAAALTLNGETMSPALRDLMYDPDIAVRYATRELVRNRRIPESSLPILALKLVTAEAIEKGYLPEESKSGLWLYDGDLLRLRDPRMGDLLADMVEKGESNGYPLSYLSPGNRGLRIKTDTVLTPEQKETLLTLWKENRAGVENSYTRDQLEAEMERCRKLAFANFQMDPRFAEIKDLMHKMNNYISYGKPEDLAALAAMGPEIVPTTLFILRNSYQGFNSGGLYDLYRQWHAMEAMDYVLAESYKGNQYAPLVAIQIDRARAYPQIKYLFEEKESVSAAIALLQIGEKRAVPAVMKWIDNFSLPWANDVTAALTVATGQKMGLPHEWKAWWEKEGMQKEWK